MNRCVLALALMGRPIVVYADDDPPPEAADADHDDDDAAPVQVEPDATIPAEATDDSLELTDFWARVDALYASGELLLAPWSGREE